MITSDGSDRVSLHHNYLHSNNQRNPSLQGSKLAEDCPDRRHTKLDWNYAL